MDLPLNPPPMTQLPTSLPPMDPPLAALMNPQPPRHITHELHPQLFLRGDIPTTNFPQTNPPPLALINSVMNPSHFNPVMNPPHFNPAINPPQFNRAMIPPIHLRNPPNRMPSEAWNCARNGIGVDTLVLLGHGTSFTIHHMIVVAHAPYMAPLVQHTNGGPLPRFLDLRDEDPSMAMCLLEFLYLGRYSGYKEEDLRGYTATQALWLWEYFDERVYRFGGRYNFPELQAFAWNRVLRCRWLLDREHHRLSQALVQQGQGQGGGFRGGYAPNSSRNPIVVDD